jgi:hypothetical protein
VSNKRFEQRASPRHVLGLGRCDLLGRGAGLPIEVRYLALRESACPGPCNTTQAGASEDRKQGRSKDVSQRVQASQSSPSAGVRTRPEASRALGISPNVGTIRTVCQEP